MIEQTKQPRKTRIDKGNRRKPAPTEREEWRNTFRAMPASDQIFELGYLTAIVDATDTTVKISGAEAVDIKLPGIEDA